MSDEAQLERSNAAAVNAEPDRVVAETVGTVRILTLNRPDKRNAADLLLQKRLVERFEETGQDSNLRAVVLTGAGRLFCAGGDRSVAQATAEGREPNEAEHRRVYGRLSRIMLELPIPIIAAVNGGALGFGADLAALSDLVVIGDDAFLSDPHVLYGLAASPAAQVIWPRLTSHAIAKEYLTTSGRIPAHDALRLGLVNRVCPAGEEVETALALARVYDGVPASSVAETKRSLNRPILEALRAFGFGDG